ncbi:MAG TPA: ABC transporter ATP-binding protein, partial [Thermodesulfobacteriota bacterium]|nr:ABC transporter ATP-binding protein [Thermodesulfobacteriota bacterium]
MAETLLRVDRIDVFYHDFHALWDISIDVEEGLVVSMIGANGAGKSTLLNAIAGVLKPSHGVIEFGGKRINSLMPYQTVSEGISMVPEGRRMFPRLTVLENLEVGCYIPKARKRKDEVLRRIYELFPILGERKNQFSSTLSGGEQQMLAIGRALMSMPKLLMLDEPSEGLSPLFTSNVFDTLKILGDQGLTILLV